MTTPAIHKPTLLLDEKRVRANIEKMAAKAAAGGVRLRPHFKTHQSAEVGGWFRDRGIGAITVSSVTMAGYFAEHGWDDITIAFPANLLELDIIDDLAGRIRLGLLVESREALTAIDGRLSHGVRLWLKIDVGTHRTGIAMDDLDAVASLADAIAKSQKYELAGLLSHAGHTYGAGSAAEIVDIYSTVEHGLNRIRREVFAGDGVEISVGDTPGCSLVSDFGGVDEIRPGNFVFYDVMQHELSACSAEEIAVAMACPVVARHDSRREIVIYGGAVHFSKDAIALGGAPCYGRVCLPQDGGWGAIDPESCLRRLSQEHGIIAAGEALWHRTAIGDIIHVLPIHSCLTANLMKGYQALGGRRIAMMP